MYSNPETRRIDARNITPERYAELKATDPDKLTTEEKGQLERYDWQAKQEELVKLQDEERARRGGCSLAPWAFRLDACVQSFLQMTGNLILSAMAAVLWLAGLFLNLTMDLTLINMSTTMATITGINNAWTAIRDLANMFFIFILLYIAISTILGLASGQTKKLLANVIIAALLINFSMFITKVIVDASNILTFTVYKEIPDIGNSFTGGGQTRLSYGLSGTIMNNLKLQSIYDITAASEGSAGNQWLNINASMLPFILATFGGSVFILITAFVFLVTAIMLAIRFVIIIFLLILSPLAFASMILPQLSSYSRKWWETLTGQAIFAPALMIMIWVTLMVSSNLKFIPEIKASTFAQNAALNANVSLGIILNFVILITMMIASLIIAKKVGEKGGHGLMQYADKFQGMIGRSAVRGVKIPPTIFGRSTGKFAGEYGLRKLDEKFGETKFGNTGIGSTLREKTSGALVSSKFGGTMSAQEAYKESKDLETTRHEITRKNEALKIIQDPTSTKEQKQDAIAQMTTKGFLDLPKEFYKDKEFMENASEEKFTALLKDERLTELEKIEARQARYSGVKEASGRLDKEIKKYEAELSAGRDPGNRPSMSSIDGGKYKHYYRAIRKLSPNETNNIRDVYPDLLHSKAFIGTTLQSTEDRNRDNEGLGRVYRDETMRDLKRHDIITANDLWDGIDPGLPEDEKIKRRNIAKSLAKRGVGTEDAATVDPSYAGLFDIAKYRQLGEKELKKSFAGKSGPELNKGRFSSMISRAGTIRFISSATIPEFGANKRDSGDTEYIVSQMLIAEERDRLDPGKGHLSPQNQTALERLRQQQDTDKSIIDIGFTTTDPKTGAVLKLKP